MSVYHLTPSDEVFYVLFFYFSCFNCRISRYKYRLQSLGLSSLTDTPLRNSLKYQRNYKAQPIQVRMPPREMMSLSFYPDLKSADLLEDGYLSMGELKEAFRFKYFPVQFSSGLHLIYFV